MPIREGAYIQTYTGIRFYPLDPQPDEICIEDIAHALSNICRFTGHTKSFYSVAQHSYLTSHYCPEHALAALLHDASEAYIADVSRPVKSLAALKGYEAVEDNIMRVIAQRFGFDYPMDQSIKEADGRMLFTEKRDLMWALDWGYELTPYHEPIVPRSPVWAKNEFLKRYYEVLNLSVAGNEPV